MRTPNGIVLIEVVGRDVVTWRVTNDPVQLMTRAVDSADVPMVAALDNVGRIHDIQRVANGPRTLIQFRKSSPFYVMLYRRRNFLDWHNEYYTYRDSWRFDGERLFQWFLPAHSRFSTLDPSTLHATLGALDGHPSMGLRTGGLATHMVYQHDETGPALPPARPFNLAVLIARLDPEEATAVEALAAATAALPDLDTLLSDTVMLRRVFGLKPASVADAPPPWVWYFAYGANMAEAKLQVRGIMPHASSEASVADWALRFNHPGQPPQEPVFANIDPVPGAVVHGVAHALTLDEAATLDRFEKGYRRVDVLMRLADGREVGGFAYQSIHPGPAGVPSARYLQLLLDGAHAHRLPAAQIAAWEALLPHAPHESLHLGARWENGTVHPIAPDSAEQHEPPEPRRRQIRL